MSIKHLYKEHVIVADNGSFPGSTIDVREGDTVIVHALNRSPYNITLHWTRRKVVVDAHAFDLQATFYGAFIIRPSLPRTFPFPQPYGEVPILLETLKINVKQGKTYLLRMVNGAIDNHLFFKIANHTFSVIAVASHLLITRQLEALFVPSITHAKAQRMTNSPQPFVFPQGRGFSMLEAFYYNLSALYTANFPDYPPTMLDFTNETLSDDYKNFYAAKSTMARKLKFNSTAI
ncbi:hypothetical protein VNO77_20463 [Canavalia gladiata]|uniref:Plastocyanin-like domain-containing protein n=1 Tax=Canavalia gladiata TaxID=3824 RepID=A0AAN9LPL6_CANGL